MNQIEIDFRQKYADLFSIKEPRQKLYFIGGVVRDLFLKRDHKDIDILCDCDTRPIAKKLASQTNGAFYMLDEERNTARVIVNQHGSRLVYDFARLQGESIQDDLLLRDFTINAMAVDFDQPEQVIDPLHGQKDLLEKKLRCCSETSFSRDPIRVIRAIRYSITCGVRIESETLRLLKEAIAGLKAVSWERKRDEIFKTLETDKPALGLELIARLGILKQLFVNSLPERPAKYPLVASLSNLFFMTEGKRSGEANRDFFEAACNLRLGRFYSKLQEYFNRRNLSDRNERQLDLFAAFLRALTDADQKEILAEFLLSKEETSRIDILLSQASRLSVLEEKRELDDRAIYLYYKEVDEVGLDLLFLGLAEKMSKEAGALPQEEWLHFLEISEKLIETWFERPKVIHPDLLLNGKDLMLEFDLTPGPKIGILLEKLREEQAAGRISSLAEAKCWVEDQLAHDELIDR